MATSPADFLMDGILSTETDGEAETEGGHREGAAVHSVSVCLGRGGGGRGSEGGTSSLCFLLTELLLFWLPCVLGSEEVGQVGKGLAGRAPGVLLILSHDLHTCTRFLT